MNKLLSFQACIDLVCKSLVGDRMSFSLKGNNENRVMVLS